MIDELMLSYTVLKDWNNSDSPKNARTNYRYIFPRRERYNRMVSFDARSRVASILQMLSSNLDWVDLVLVLRP